jgi:hypothetical protein
MASEVTAAAPAVQAQEQSDQPNNKRKPSRRANTAERRATHNAVERQRRETLNGRFLDLAALLPNLSQIRRPSKSSIVNSSIAHIHASRRHRMLASRELRNLKLEADALRREVNEWRDRSGIPRIEEPIRGEGFSMVLSGELEALVVPGMVGGFGMEDDDDDYPSSGNYTYDDHPAEMVKNANAHPFAQALPPNGSPSPVSNASSSPPYRPSISVTAQPVMGAPIIASPTAMSFDNPAMAGVYTPADSHIPHQQHIIYHPSGYIHPHHLPPQHVVDAEKVAHWNMMQQHQGMNADQAYLASLAARRERSASMSTGSRSSGSASPVQTYEVPPQFDPGFEQPGYEGQWTGGPKHQQPVFAVMI